MKEFHIKNEKLLMDLMSMLTEKGFSRDETIGMILHSKSEDNWKILLDEIGKHPEFTKKRWLLFALALGETVKEGE